MVFKALYYILSLTSVAFASGNFAGSDILKTMLWLFAAIFGVGFLLPFALNSIGNGLGRGIIVTLGFYLVLFLVSLTSNWISEGVFKLTYGERVANLEQTIVNKDGNEKNVVPSDGTNQDALLELSELIEKKKTLGFAVAVVLSLLVCFLLLKTRIYNQTRPWQAILSVIIGLTPIYWAAAKIMQ